MARSRRRDPRLEAIGERIAAAIMAELEQAGYPLDYQVYGRLLRADGPIITALERATLARQTVAYDERGTRRAVWAKDAGAVSWEELQVLWGLSRAQMRAARDLDYVQPVEVPLAHREGFDTPHYYASRSLTDEERARIASVTLLSRTDAAARLGITPAAFDKLRKAQGLEPAETAPTRTGHALFLYRQSDIDRLALQPLSHAGPEPPADENGVSDGE